ncbi:MAG TPA: HD domain-containing phosphohydrolase [Gemmatimonadaceae bacterium]|nr:HD domain-containing phosphohydrolase [Gemmatimonadaceae bacterium]
MCAESITLPPFCLVVDDEPRLRQVLVHLMSGDGFTCLEAGNGEEALVLLHQHPVTLVMSDLRMPKMDGLELLRQVRARWPDVAMVMITAVADVEVAVSCLAIGAMDYLTKPFHLEEVRARVAQAMENRRLVLENRGYQESLQDKVAVQARRLEELFMASIQSLAEVLELKDPYTRGHSVRVSHYSAVIARELGIEGEMLRQIELGGHVHDIGKIGVREEVLNKPGKLTAAEYEHIMTHPVVGWRILAPLLAETPVALNIVRSHHERYDGGGMPDRLAGDAIPLEARIAAAADSFDAMTSDRPYRPDGLTVNDAMQELVRCSGTQFDPNVVAAVVRALETERLTVVRRLTEPRGMPVVPRVVPPPARSSLLA